MPPQKRRRKASHSGALRVFHLARTLPAVQELLGNEGFRDVVDHDGVGLAGLKLAAQRNYGFDSPVNLGTRPG